MMLKSVISAVVLSGLCYFARAQSKNNPADSIIVDNIWHQGIKKLSDFAQSQHAADVDSALRYFQYSIRVIDSLGLTPNFMYEAWLRIGESYFLLHNIPTGKDYFIKVINVYQAAGDKKREARTWFRMGTKLTLADYKNAAIPFAYQKALDLYQSLQDRQNEADAFLEMGKYYYLVNRLDSAESCFLGAETIYKATGQSRLYNAHYWLTNVYRNKGDLNRSLSYALQNISDLTTKGDTASFKFSFICLQLGTIYSDMGKWEKSIYFYRQAVDKSIAFFPGEATTESAYNAMNDLIQALVATNKPREAFTTAQQFIDKYPPSGNTQKGLAAEMMGHAYAALQQYERAEQYFLQMMHYYRLSSPSNGIGLAEWGPKVLREFYVQRANYDKALQTLKGQHPGRLSANLPYSAVTEDELSHYRIDSARGDLASALAHFKRYKELSDSALNATRSKQLAELEIKYETAQKENDIRQLKKDGLLQQAEVAHANNIRNLTLGGIVLLLAFTCLLYNSYRLNRRKNSMLHQLIGEKDDLLSEKEWLLKEIHHRVKNNLQIVMGLLQRQSAYVHNEAALSAIQESENRMYAISLIHQKLYQSDNLHLIYMPEYINELINYLKESSVLDGRIHFEKKLDEIYLDVSQAVPLGLILNEAITNAIKYGYPRQETGIIGVSLFKEGDSNLLVVKDGGPGLPTGFDVDKLDSFGMNLMRGLSKQLRGTFDFTNGNGGGVTISIRFATEEVGLTGRSGDKNNSPIK